MNKRYKVINNTCSSAWNVLVLVSIEHPLDVAKPVVLAGAACVVLAGVHIHGGAIFANNNAVADGGEGTRGTSIVGKNVRITTTVFLGVRIRP